MKNALPIILGAGALLLLTSRKKKGSGPGDLPPAGDDPQRGGSEGESEVVIVLPEKPRWFQVNEWKVREAQRLLDAAVEYLRESLPVILGDYSLRFVDYFAPNISMTETEKYPAVSKTYYVFDLAADSPDRPTLDIRITGVATSTYENATAPSVDDYYINWDNSLTVTERVPAGEAAKIIFSHDLESDVVLPATLDWYKFGKKDFESQYALDAAVEYLRGYEFVGDLGGYSLGFVKYDVPDTGLEARNVFVHHYVFYLVAESVGRPTLDIRIPVKVEEYIALNEEDDELILYDANWDGSLTVTERVPG